MISLFQTSKFNKPILVSWFIAKNNKNKLVVSNQLYTMIQASWKCNGYVHVKSKAVQYKNLQQYISIEQNIANLYTQLIGIEMQQDLWRRFFTNTHVIHDKISTFVWRRSILRCYNMYNVCQSTTLIKLDFFQIFHDFLLWFLVMNKQVFCHLSLHICTMKIISSK